MRARSAVPPTPQRRAVVPTVATALAVAVLAAAAASPAGAAPANSAPAAPANLTTYPPTTCGDVTNPTWLSQDLAVAHGAGDDTTVSVYASTGPASSAGAQWWDSAADADQGGFALGNARLTVADLDGGGADDVVALYRDGADTSVKVRVSGGGPQARQA
ncbi:hypothetical protein AB0J86_09880 [Micromonospora sp. NPDC049559]|uniref:hypothetical protein n=1 Tax=Micromonospora sp. NPDC049559 TaxID=3155923 RepID=UPI0034465FA4